MKQACADLSAIQRFIKPDCPWQNGNVERLNRTLATEWAYRHTFTSNAERTAALAPWLEDTCSYDGRQYGSSLGAEVATTLLPLITRAGLGEYAVQEIVTGIATVHPELVLDYLLELGNGDGPIPAVIHKLSGAFDDHAETFAGWVHEHLDQDTTTIGHVLNAAANHHLTENQANALANLCENLTGPKLMALLGCLAPLTLWASNRPGLVEAAMRRARETNTAAAVRERVRRDGMSLRGVEPRPRCFREGRRANCRRRPTDRVSGCSRPFPGARRRDGRR